MAYIAVFIFMFIFFVLDVIFIVLISFWIKENAKLIKENDYLAAMVGTACVVGWLYIIMSLIMMPNILFMIIEKCLTGE